MKYLYILFLLIISCPINAQNKKEQIEYLNSKYDSLKVVFDKSNTDYNNRIINLQDSLSIIRTQKLNLDISINKLELKCDSIQNLNNQLFANVTTKKVEVLELRNLLLENKDSLNLLNAELVRTLNFINSMNSNIPENNYDQLSKSFLTTGKDVSKISAWIREIVVQNYDVDTSCVTIRCMNYINDAIDLAWGYDGSIDEATFTKKWNKFYDLKYSGFGHMFQTGNGGWASKRITELKYLGSLNNGEWFKVTLQGSDSENDFSTTIIRVLKIVNKSNKFYIDNFISLSDE